MAEYRDPLTQVAEEKADKPDNTTTVGISAYQITPIQSFLGVDTPTGSEKTQLDYIFNNLKGDGREVNLGEVLNQLRQIEIKLGATRLGETRLGKIYNYLRSVDNVKRAEQIRDAYLR